MICKVCQSHYTRMAGVKSFKKDYGFCSMACAIQSKSPCPNCGSPVLPYDGEKTYAYIKRLFCSQKCGASYISSKPKSKETRQKQSAYHRNRPKEHIDHIQASLKEFRKTDTAKEMYANLGKRSSEWRRNNPQQAEEMVRKQAETRAKNGFAEKVSREKRAFFQSPEGQKMKQKYHDLYAGKPRPLHVTQKMKESLRKHWDSEEGKKQREHFSFMQLQGTDTTPYGPSWTTQRAKIRQRDNHTCVLCGIEGKGKGRALDVHHITRRAFFGYTPGKNLNYLWANHPANLVTLCQSCHGKVERDPLLLPERYRTQAKELWDEFTSYSPSSLPTSRDV